MNELFTASPRLISESSRPTPLASSCHCFCACCLFVLRGDVGSALLSAVTHLQLQQQKLLSTAQRVEANAEVSWWRVSRLLVGPLSILGEMKVGGLCRCVQLQQTLHLFIQFVIFFFPFVRMLKSLAPRLKPHLQKKEVECDSVWIFASNEYNFSYEEGAVSCKDKGLQANMFVTCERSELWLHFVPGFSLMDVKFLFWNNVN